MLYALLLMTVVTLQEQMHDRPPPMALVATIQKGILYKKCFKPSVALKQEFHFEARTEGFVQHVDENHVIFRISEAGEYRKPGLFVSRFADPTIDDQEFNFIAGVYDVRRRRIVSQGCYDNIARSR